jgi:glycosyltransferase involved in cell wall biosynthesis
MMLPGKTICFVSALFHPHFGGVERYTYQFSKSLIARGFQVIVITTDSDRQEYEEVIENIKVYRLPVFHSLGIRYPILRPDRNFFRIMKKIGKENIDLFVINTRFYLTSPLGLYLAGKKKKKAIVIEHGSGHLTVHNGVLDFFGRVYDHALTGIVKAFKPEFYGVSKACNEWLEHYGIKANGVLYNGIDASYSVPDPVDIRKQYHIPGDGLIITFAGRLVKEKGILVFLKALESLNEGHRNLFFFIAGSGPAHPGPDEKTTDLQHTFFPGPLEFNEMQNLLNYTDIFVFPSTHPEGLPTILLEAGLSKCAIIATPVGGVKELMPDPSLGISISPGDPADIMRAIELLNNDRAYLARLKENFHRFVLENFNWKVLSGKFIGMFLTG